MIHKIFDIYLLFLS